MMRNAILAIAFVLACGAGAAHAQAPVADFFSISSLLDGQALPAGTSIEAYDSESVRCGYAEANADGGFLIHVYGNDPMTPSIDEGAREGEILRWKLSGIDLRPEDAQWIANLIGMFADARWENGAAKEIRFDVHTTALLQGSWSELKERYRP